MNFNMDLSSMVNTLMKLPRRQMANIRRGFGEKGIALDKFVALIIKYTHLADSYQRILDERKATESKKTDPSRSETKGDLSPRKFQVVEEEAPEENPFLHNIDDNNDAVLSLTSDLTNVYNQIDIDKRECVKWEEFIGYIIEQGSALYQDQIVKDHYVPRRNYILTKTGLREYVTHTLWIPEHANLVVAIEGQIQSLNPYFRGDDGEEARKCFEFHLTKRMEAEQVGVYDMIYLAQKDLLVILQKNLVVSFYFADARAFSGYGEGASLVGQFQLPYQCYHIS